MAEFNESFLIKLQTEVHTYNSINSIDINIDKTNHIPQKFLQF